MKTLIAILLLVTSSLKANEETKRLTRIFDLSPKVEKEVYKEITQQERERLSQIKLNEDQIKYLTGSHRALSHYFTETLSITLYSLDPISEEKAKEFEDSNKTKAGSEQRFYGYPIFGFIELKKPDEVDRWNSFFVDQIIPGATFLCDFEPRHGISLKTASGHVDFLVCFKCSQLEVIANDDLDRTYNPIFSRIVRDILNHLFDSANIKRDKPKQRANK